MTDNIIINTPNPNSVTENSEIGRATEFAHRISKTHCYIDESDKWHIFNGNIWKEENKKFLHAEALEFFKENASEISIIEDERDRNDETRANIYETLMGYGGHDKVRTCDPYDVNVVLYR